MSAKSAARGAHGGAHGGADSMHRPGQSKGLLEVFRKRYLLQLLVRKETRVRYRGSYLGMVWSYAKPATQFLVFYFAIGVFMGMNRAIPNYVVYMFSGVVVMNYFSEAFNQGTRSLTANQDLVKKIYLPRELFPISALWVAFWHFVPQMVILVLGALLYGWRPGIVNLLAIAGAIAFLVILCLAMTLFGAALNVLFRDTENFVELILQVATWASPVLYKWQMVHEVLGDVQGGWMWYLYQLNPLTVIVELFHLGFWGATAGVNDPLPGHFGWFAIASFLGVLVMLFAGEKVFRHFDGRFAQEL